MLLTKSKILDPRSMDQDLNPRYKNKMKWSSCGITFQPNFGSPRSRKYSSQFEIPISKLGFSTESNSKVHLWGAFDPLKDCLILEFLQSWTLIQTHSQIHAFIYFLGGDLINDTINLIYLIRIFLPFQCFAGVQV